MLAMQYKIHLPNEYDMNVIRKRVEENGHKTDGFKDLLFKAYLITEKQFMEGNNEYSPLYIWKDSEGMNRFIFEGYYDNILHSFGWQKINIGIPLKTTIGENFNKAKYVIEKSHVLPVSQKIPKLHFSKNYIDTVGKTLIYNPDKWHYTEFYFFKEKPPVDLEGKLYQILYLSM